jgi:Flp pilus assembly protein TadD
MLRAQAIIPSLRARTSGVIRLQSAILCSVCLGLAFLVWLSYLPVPNADFVGYDDELYVTKNSFVQSGPTFKSLIWAFTTFATGNWHPLTWVSHMLDCAIYGLDPRSHHITNLAIHTANTILLFLALNAITRSLWKSAVVAALFGVHPLHVESVAWISERKDVLSTLFWMLTLLAYGRYIKAPRAFRYLCVFALFTLGLLAKPMLVSLPIVLLAFDYWPLARFPHAGIQNGAHRSITHLVLEKVPLGLLSLASCIVTYLAQKGGVGSQMGCLPDLPLGIRASNALVSYIAYLAKTIWPVRLAVIYPHPRASIPTWQVAACAAVFVAVWWLAIRLRRSHPYVFVGWLWYVITLVPVIGIIQVGEQSMADRYTYIPLIGIFISLVWGIGCYARRFLERKSFVIGLVIVVLGLLVALAARTYAQACYWQDSVSLFTRALQVTKDNYVAHLNLGVALEARGDYESARYHYEQALRLQPSWPLALYNYAVLLHRTGDTASAVSTYRKLIRLQPDHALAHYNLGVIYDDEGKIEVAIREYKAAIRSAPDFAPAHVNLAVDLYEQGRYQDAWRHVREAERLGFAVNEDFIRALKTKMRREP